MTLKHRSKIITPDLGGIKDPAVVEALIDLFRQLQDLYPNVYDDLVNDGLIKKDFDNNKLVILKSLGAVPVADATGSGDIVAQFNALLASLRAANILDTA